MASPTAPYIDETGIHAPSFNDILTYLKNAYRAIYGADVYLENDSQDGQLLGIFASAINDANSAAIQIYNAFSPATALGAGLSSVVKINGLTRKTPTQSTVDVNIVGVAGTQIFNGVVSDTNGNNWDLPATVTIPTSGSIVVTATAENLGAITAEPNTVTRIATPTRGWQTVTNTLAATAGAPVESDAQLRIRQSTSTMLPSVTALDGMIGAVVAVEGVTRYQVYENDTNITDANGVPSHSVAFVVEGGDSTAIATAIASKKTPGAGTFGTTTISVSDAYGIPHGISFFRPTSVPINVAISITPLVGYTTQIGQSIVDAIVEYINTSAIGSNVSLSKLYVPANLTGVYGATFNIKSLQIARNNGSLTAADVVIAFNEVAICSAANVTLTVG